MGDSLFGFVEIATEWSDGSVINLGGLDLTFSEATGINDAGQVVGFAGGQAVEWSGGRVIGLPVLGPGDSLAYGINDGGQAVGLHYVGSVAYATEWSGGSVINLGGLPGSTFSEADSINDAGQAVGTSYTAFNVPKILTWAMMLVGFAGLAFVGYRRAKAGHATLARERLLSSRA